MSDFLKYRNDKWNQFLEKYKVRKTGVELFSHKDLEVEVNLYGKSNLPVLSRNIGMENLIINEAKKLILDFQNGKNQYEGLIYIMYSLNSNKLNPLYIGKTEKLGHTSNLSTNIKSMDNERPSKRFFARWGNNYKYHIGDLSAVVIAGHEEKYRSKKYFKWADSLFENYPTTKPRLKQPIYFWCRAWGKKNRGIWDEFGPATLTFLEYQLIGIASSLYHSHLLNSEGKNRS